MAFSAITARGSNVSNTSSTTISVSPTANLTVGKIVFVSCTTDNNDISDGTSNNHTSVTDTNGNIWNKVFEVTETDGADADGSTTSLWWGRITTEITTTDSITLNLGQAEVDCIISLVEVTVGAGKEVAYETGFTPSDSGTSLSHTLSGLTSREYLFFGLFGAEGEDTAKTSITNYVEQFDLVSSTAGVAAANVQQHVQTRILTGTGDTVTSSAVTFTSGIQSLTAFYEVDIPVSSTVKVKVGGVFSDVTSYVKVAGVFILSNPLLIGDVVQNGLLFSFDATNNVSYPTSGSTWFDLSGNNNDATLTDGTSYDTDGGGTLVFDGVSGSAELTMDVRRDFTLECWAKYDVITNFAYFGLGPRSTSNGLHILNRSSTSIRFGMYNNDTDFTTTTLVTNQWYHLAFTYNHSSPYTKQAFLNGVELTGTELQTQLQFTGTGTFRIGATYSTANNYADGKISEARMYDIII